MKTKATASLARATRQAARSGRTGRAAGADRAAAHPNARRPPAIRAAKEPVVPKPAPGLDPGPVPGLDRGPAPGPDPGVERNGAALRHIGGSQSDDWNDLIATETARARCPRGADDTIEAGDIDAVVGALAGIAPQDEFDGMMAAQLIAGHGALMECYARAALGAERDESLRHAARLSRAFVQVMGALQRYRKAAQGRQQKSENQPHAKDIAPHLVPRLERLRRENEAKEPPEPLSEEELADFAEDGLLLDAMMRREPYGSVTGRSKAPPRALTGDDVFPLTDAELEVMEDVRERLAVTDPLAVESAIVAAAAARAKSEKQPHAVPAGRPLSPVLPTAAAASVSAPTDVPVTSGGKPAAASTKSEEQPHAQATAPAPAHAQSAKQPRAKLTLGEALTTLRESGDPLDVRKFNELYVNLAPGDRDAFLEAVNARAREQIHGKPPFQPR